MEEQAEIRIVVSPEELKVIERLRKTKKEEAEREQRMIDILELSAKYVTHLRNSGGGHSYSDFCSSMGYDYGELDYIGWKGDRIYRTVVCLIATTRDFVNQEA